MKKMLFAASLGLALFAAGTPAAMAQSMESPDALYKALGEKPGLTRLVDGFAERILADGRIAPFFKDTKLPAFKESLALQLCQVSGGPCQYKGPDMKSAHANFDIHKSHFNALVEDLQAAMNAQGLPFGVQNQLLARLAPLHRDTITVR